MWLPESIADPLIAAVALVALGLLLNRLERALRPSSLAEFTRALKIGRQLRIDLLRAQGHTRRSATKAVDAAQLEEARGEVFRSQVVAVRDTQDLLSSLDRRAARDAVAPVVMDNMQRDFANGVLPPDLEDAFVEAMLEVGAATDQSAARMLASYRDGSGRDSIKELLRTTIRERLGI